MKLVIILAVQVAIVFAACSITHRTGDFACSSSSDCNSGRSCVDGYCIISGTEPDARTTNPDGRTTGPIDAPSSNNCPAACTSCDQNSKSCTIDCNAGADCSSQVACPAGWTCDVKCDTDNACRKGVECGAATSCKVECSGRGSCEDIDCGTNRCDVECTGTGSCRANIECGDSCGCDVRCTGAQSCADGAVDCTAVACNFNKGCSSLSLVCHSCP